MDINAEATRCPDKSYWTTFEEACSHAKKQTKAGILSAIAFDKGFREYTVTGWEQYQQSLITARA
jgi:hypothetical protein